MNHQQKFGIKILQQLILLGPLVIKNSLIIVLALVLIKPHINTLTVVIYFLLLADIIPTIIVHIQYLIKNWSNVLILDPYSRTIQFKNSKEEMKYLFDDINYLHRYSSYGKGTGWHSFGEYRYYKIIFKDKKPIIITCALINDIENNLEKVLSIEPIRHLRVVALIYN